MTLLHLPRLTILRSIQLASYSMLLLATKLWLARGRSQDFPLKLNGVFPQQPQNHFLGVNTQGKLGVMAERVWFRT